MKRTTLFLDEGTERELHLLAQRQRRPVAALVRDALSRYLNQARRRQGLRLRFLAVGRSGHGDTAARAEELLWEDPPSAARQRRGASGGK